MAEKSEKTILPTTDLPEGWNSPIRPEYLIKFNKLMFVMHLIQGLLMVYLGTLLNFSRAIYTYYFIYTDPERTQPPIPNPEMDFIFENLGSLVGAFLLMSSFAHFLLAWPLREKYIHNLAKNYNPIRWFEYAFSSSVMILLIAIFFTISGIHILFTFFVLNFIMNAFGWQMEKLNKEGNKGKVDWSPYILGFVAGAAPWIVLTSYLNQYYDQGLEDFVVAIYFVEIVLFNCFAFVMLAYYKKWGKFKDYVYGERVYQILSLVAKTLLAWIVFGGVYQPN